MILAIVQARTSSSRLPGKVMLPVHGEPMLLRQMERVRRSAMLDAITIATSDRSDDDAVADLAAQAGVGLFRGSLDDVLDRYYRAAEDYRPDHVVRITGDCPLIDWTVVDGCIRFTLDGGYDYASNTLRPTWPDGLDVEVMTFDALRTSWKEGEGIVEREHVTQFIHRRPERFRLGSYENALDLSGLRWTVDEPEDLAFVRQVYDALYPANAAFTSGDVLDLLERRPEISLLNMRFERNEGLKRSEEAESKAGKNG
jgi:spore coat polysaccharide biosynthesis protein SpsF